MVLLHSKEVRQFCLYLKSDVEILIRGSVEDFSRYAIPIYQTSHQKAPLLCNCNNDLID